MDVIERFGAQIEKESTRAGFLGALAKGTLLAAALVTGGILNARYGSGTALAAFPGCCTNLDFYCYPCPAGTTLSQSLCCPSSYQCGTKYTICNACEDGCPNCEVCGYTSTSTMTCPC